MPLSPEQEGLWAAIAKDVGDIPADFEPIRVHVQSIPESTGDLYYEINRNRLLGKISDEQAEQISWFFGAVLESERPEAVIAELPVIENEEGTYIQLVFPSSGEARA